MPRPRARARWTAVGLDICDSATLEDLAGWTRILCEARESGEVALADIISYARRNDLLPGLEGVFERLEFDMATINRAMAIADVPAGLRAKELNSEHYFVVSGLIYEEQMKWLRAAVEHGLTGFELKRSIELGRVMTRKELLLLSGSGSGGVVSYQGILTKWKRWESQVGGADVVLSWPEPVLREFIDEWRGVKELLDKAESVLRGEG